MNHPDFMATRSEQRDRAVTDFTTRMKAQPTSPPASGPLTPPRAHTKRHVTLPERHASTIEVIARRVAKAWPAIETAAAALTHPTMRAATTHQGGRSNEHPDPVAGIALGHEHYDDLREAISAWLAQGIWIEDKANAFLRQHPDVARAGDAELLRLRCDDPVCTANAVRRGKCWRHYRDWLEHTADRVHAVSTPDLLEPATVETSAPTHTVASCGQCDWQTPALDTEHARILLADHHLDGCTATVDA